MIHYFSDNILFEGPYEFTDPFRYAPHPLVINAAQEIQKHAPDCFSEGKMLGVLICRETETQRVGYLSAFSGTVRKSNGEVTATLDGYVPPIYDLTDPDGEFKRREAEISELNSRIDTLRTSDELQTLNIELADAEQERDKELNQLRTTMSISKRERDKLRQNCSDEDTLTSLIRKSQHEKAELRRLKILWDNRISEIKSRLTTFTDEIESLKKQRASMSEALQDWIFRQYIVHNARGEELSIADIFAESELIPPGGTGECAAPKLLEYAYRHGLEPLAMGEFWYGKSSDTAVRSHGRFYPSCTSKCGPLLGFMLKGLSLLTEDITTESPVIIYEDGEIVVVEKPAGMPSVPGLDGRPSLQEWLSHHGEIHQTHRLDMDTSGVMVFAKTHSSAVNIRQQFEAHTIHKTYIARVSYSHLSVPADGEEEIVIPPWPQGEGPTKWEGLFLTPHLLEQQRGRIELPLGPDYDERPRQKVDFRQGKAAFTEYEVMAVNNDGTADLKLHPHTGRTHQLRVHCAHALGLASPIVGDRLYGGDTATRLHLHALSITFTHPVTNDPVTFTSKHHCYK